MVIKYDKELIDTLYKTSIRNNLAKYDETIQEAISKRDKFLNKTNLTDIDYFVERYPVMMRYILYKIEYEEKLEKKPEGYTSILDNDYEALIIDGGFYGYFTEIYNLMYTKTNQYIFFFYRFLYEELLYKEVNEDDNILELLMEDYRYPPKTFIDRIDKKNPFKDKENMRAI